MANYSAAGGGVIRMPRTESGIADLISDLAGAVGQGIQDYRGAKAAAAGEGDGNDFGGSIGNMLVDRFMGQNSSLNNVMGGSQMPTGPSGQPIDLTITDTKQTPFGQYNFNDPSRYQLY